MKIIPELSPNASFTTELWHSLTGQTSVTEIVELLDTLKSQRTFSMTKSITASQLQSAHKILQSKKSLNFFLLHAQQAKLHIANSRLQNL